MTTARKLAGGQSKPRTITLGVVGTGDPRIDEASRQRAGNIVKTIADLLAAEVRTPDGKAGGRRSGRRSWSTANRRPTSSAGSSARRASMRWSAPRIPGPSPNSRS